VITEEDVARLQQVEKAARMVIAVMRMGGDIEATTMNGKPVIDWLREAVGAIDLEAARARPKSSP
jgi:hypothetical protein